MIRRLPLLLAILASLLLAACSGVPVERAPAEPAKIAALSKEIRALGPDIDPEEAERAARVAYARTAELARAYQITDGPILHNTKVNLGLKPRGLCWHWAEDMQSGLARENFRTLTLHRAIANADNPFRLEHSTLIVSHRGGTMFEGIVLDPWRKGGRLTWIATASDTRYNWRPRQEVLADKRREIARRAAKAAF